VSVGDVGSGTEFNSRHILEAHGLSFADIQVQNLGFGPSADALRDGQIDAFIATAGAPTPALVDFAVTRDLVILPIEADAINRLRQNYPFYAPYTIAAGTYRIPAPVNTVSVKATLVASHTLTEETVYRLTRALFDNKAEIISAHARGNDLDPAYAVDALPADLHPGAARYFRAINAIR
jgi:TRAP transporter TAXI family solute receptor